MLTSAIKVFTRSGRWAILFACGACMLGYAEPAPAQLFQKSENFDTDPGWDGVNNIIPDPGDTNNLVMDFGFRAGTNIAGGTNGSGTGEAGGLIDRTPAGFYADNVGALDPTTDTLSASGKWAFGPSGGTWQGNMGVGWFNKFLPTNRDNSTNTIGFRTDEQNFLEVYAMGNENRAVPQLNGTGPNCCSLNIDQNTSLTFNLSFTPTANTQSSEVGGTVMGSFDVVTGGQPQTYSVSIDITVEERDAMEPFNRFGIFNQGDSGNNIVEAFIDDLVYTASPPIPDPEEREWIFGGSGDYAVGSNWEFGFSPNTSALTALFGSSIAAPSTVFTQTDVTVKGFTFDNANSYAVTGPANVELTFEAETGNPFIQVLNGGHELQLPVNLVEPTAVNTSAGGEVRFELPLNLGGTTLTKTGPGTVLVNNEVATGSGTLDALQGIVGGVGTVGGNLNNSATVAPGVSVLAASAGTLNVGGTYTQTSAGTLDMNVNGTASGGGHDQLSVSGSATLDGTLDIQTDQGFTPGVGATPGDIGDSFVIVTAATRTGEFSTVNGQHAGAGIFYDVGYNLTNVSLGAFQAQVGDADGDRAVDITDFNTLSGNFDPNGDNSATNDWTTADFDLDGDVDITDFNGLSANFAPNGYASSAGQVPEPAAGLLVLLGVTCWLIVRRGGTIMNGSRTTIKGLLIVLAALLGTAEVASAQTFFKVETFDNDPGWQSLNNRDETFFLHDFGRNPDASFPQPTNFAEGASPGEIGGIFVTNFPNPSIGPFPAYFADDIGSLDPLNDVLTFSGKVKYSGGNGFMNIGWFDKDGTLTPQVDAGGIRQFIDFIGIRTDDDRMNLLAGTTEQTVLPRQGQSAFSFSLTYDPTAGSFGTLSGSINGSASTTINLKQDDRNNLPAAFDSFGIMANRNLANGQRTTEFYFDDLVYTTSIAQPAITQVEWSVDASLNAASGGGWFPPVPPTSNEVTAILGSAIQQSRVLVSDVDLTMKNLFFDNANSYVVAGLGTVNLDGGTSDAAVSVVQGAHDMRIEVALNTDLDVDIAAGSSLTFNNGLDLNGFTINKTGPGDLVINNSLTLDGGSIIGTVVNNVVPEPSGLVLCMLILLSVALADGRRSKHD